MKDGRERAASKKQAVRVCPGCKVTFVCRDQRKGELRVRDSNSTICPKCRASPGKLAIAQAARSRMQVASRLREKSGESRALHYGTDEPPLTIWQRDKMVLKMLRGEW